MKKILSLAILLSTLVLPRSAFAADSFWNQCGTTGTIARCETYDCPQGDTNGDGRCNTNDTDAKLQEAKNDSFCANPLSGCGEVLYYSANADNACAIRVKEAQNNCDLYKAGNPNITPAPVSTTETSNQTHFGDASPSPKPVTIKTLPKTGPALWISIIIASIGVYGLYVAEKK